MEIMFQPLGSLEQLEQLEQFNGSSGWNGSINDNVNETL